MTALEGEDLALSESDDLIILDIMLPKKDGLAVLKSLREEGLETPVLMLTARGEVHDRVAASTQKMMKKTMIMKIKKTNLNFSLSQSFYILKSAEICSPFSAFSPLANLKLQKKLGN